MRAEQATVGFGVVLAMIVSYDHNQSVLWAIMHGLFSWLYIIYHWVMY